MDALNLLTHPRPRLPLSASQHSVSASDPHQPHVDNSSTPSLPEHGRTTPHRPDSQSLIPVRPLSQMSTRARRHSQSQSKDQRRSRRLSQSRSPSQQDLHPTADPNAQALPSRPASQLSKSTGHTRRPSFQDAPSRPVSQLSAYISSSHSRPVSRTLAAVPGTPTAARPLAPASPALEVGHLLPLSFSFAPNPKTPDHPHPAPPESEGTFGSASGRRAQIAKQQQHELRLQKQHQQQQRRQKDAEAEKLARAALHAPVRRGKSEAERIKDAYRSAGAGQRPAPAPPAAVAAPSAPLTTAVAPTPTPRTVKLAPVKTPNTNANGNAAPAPVPMPLPRPARWEPGAGALIRSAVLSQVPDAYRWSGEEFGEYIRLEEELGYGNWGSVWSLRLPKQDTSSPSSHRAQNPDKNENGEGSDADPPTEVYACKLVLFASERKTAEIRLLALWKEFQILRGHLPSAHSLPSSQPSHGPSSTSTSPNAEGHKAEQEKRWELLGPRHPGVLDPLAFIEYPLGGLMIMPLLSRQMPVCVREEKARRWFERVLDAVGWMHARGVVHNDIKPANIMLTEDDQPVLIDFGFAQHHPEEKEERFQSQLAYGTPEYLSPERARGQKHDTRKSDVWSLGVTFFEVLAGRTPFENTPAPSSDSHASVEDGEEGRVKADPDMSTAEGLKVYWERTVKGEWVGEWVMSRGAEKLLKRMMNPSAEGRPWAQTCMADPYFHTAFPTEKALVALPKAIVDVSVVQEEVTQDSLVVPLPDDPRERKASLRSIRVESKGTAPPTPSNVKSSRIPIPKEHREAARAAQPAFEVAEDRVLSSPTDAAPNQSKRKSMPMSPTRGRAGKENKAALAGVVSSHARKPLVETKGLLARGDFESKKEKEKAVENVVMAKKERRKAVSPPPPMPSMTIESTAEVSFSAPETVIIPPPHPSSEAGGAIDNLKDAVKTNLSRSHSVGNKDTLIRPSTANSHVSQQPLHIPMAVGRKASERISTALARSQSEDMSLLDNARHTTSPHKRSMTDDLQKYSNTVTGVMQNPAGKENVATKDDRMSIWLQSLDKVVEDTKAAYGQTRGKTSVSKIPTPVTPSTLKKTPRPALRELFEPPPTEVPLPESVISPSDEYEEPGVVSPVVPEVAHPPARKAHVGERLKVFWERTVRATGLGNGKVAKVRRSASRG